MYRKHVTIRRGHGSEFARAPLKLTFFGTTVGVGRGQNFTVERQSNVANRTRAGQVAMGGKVSE